MKIAHLSLSAACLLGLAASASAGTFSSYIFTDDASTLISTANTYTHTVDITPGTTAETINGVTFIAGGPSGANYTVDTGNAFPGPYGPIVASGNINTLLSNFYYGAQPVTNTETLTLTGLTAGQTYIARFYGASFNNTSGDLGGRYDNVTDGQGGTILYDENMTAGTPAGSVLQDIYTPTTTSETFTFAINTTNSNVGDTNRTTTGDSYHQYGFSNQVVPEPSTIAALIGGAGMLLGLRRRRA